MARDLRTANHGNLPSPITYNPKTETITLKGFSEEGLEEVMTKLRSLVETYSKSWSEKFLLTSNSGTEPEALTSRVYTHDNPRTCANCDSQKTKVFPIRVKDDPKLVELWLKSILPALPQILSRIVGASYSAILVRQGQVDFDAHPCIQIESPVLPSLNSRQYIKDSLRRLCDKENYQSDISIRFYQGSVEDLTGGEDEVRDGFGESVDEKRSRFNLTRPCSELRMGASLGLLCSKRVSGTLGGFVLINDTKYMLTSDHFVENSEAQGNRDNDDPHRNITSPSRWDLGYMKNNLNQTIRDLDCEIDQLTSQNYGNLDVPEEDFERLPWLHETQRRKGDFERLLSQFSKNDSKKELAEYTIGNVHKRSTGTITMHAPIHLNSPGTTFTYHLDWALCRLRSETSENRHKYRSKEDAIADDPIETQDRAIESGEVVDDKCEPNSGNIVYYFGQGSGYRRGKVSMPMLKSRTRAGETITTNDWIFMDFDGQYIQKEVAAGDSGSWVIREADNKVMGQVCSHDLGMVLFTPIDAIFEDIRVQQGVKAFLPPSSPDPGPIPPMTRVSDLSAVRSPPLPQPYPFSMFDKKPVTGSDKQPVGISLSRNGSLESSRKEVSPSETNNTDGQVSPNLLCDLPSSPPGLTNSPQSPVSTPDIVDSPRSFEASEFSNGQMGNAKLPSKPLVESEMPYLALDEQGGHGTLNLTSQALDLETQCIFRICSTARTLAWPVDRKNKIAKTWRGNRIAQRPQSHIDCAPTSARSLLAMWPWLACRQGIYTRHLKPAHRLSTLTMRFRETSRTQTHARPSPTQLSVSPGFQGISEWGYRDMVA